MFAGYYATVFSIEYLGRKWIQIQGFLFEALFRKSLGPVYENPSVDTHFYNLQSVSWQEGSTHSAKYPSSSVSPSSNSSSTSVLTRTFILLHHHQRLYTHLPLLLQYHLLLSRRSLPHQIPCHRTRYLSRQRKSRRNHLRFGLQQSHQGHRYSCRPLEYVHSITSRLLSS